MVWSLFSSRRSTRRPIRRRFVPLTLEPLEDRTVPSTTPTLGGAGPGVFDPATATWYLRSQASEGAPDAGQFQFGAPNWIPVVGDWTGTGHVGIGVVDPSTNTWYLGSTATPGAPDVGTFQFGVAGWKPVVGDWTGTHHAGIGVFDPATANW